jgi:hypothetical protein
MKKYKVKARGFPECFVCADTRSKARHKIASQILEIGYAESYKDALSQIEYIRLELSSQIKQE